MDEQSQTPSSPSLEVKRKDDFESRYANNVRLEPSVWDLKLVFGEIDQSSGLTIDQHTAITIPWIQVKLLAYFLDVNLAIYESDNAYIRVPRSVIPAPFDFSSLLAANPALAPFMEYLGAIHRKYFPESYPDQAPAVGKTVNPKDASSAQQEQPQP